MQPAVSTVLWVLSILEEAKLLDDILLGVFFVSFAFSVLPDDSNYRYCGSSRICHANSHIHGVSDGSQVAGRRLLI